MMKNSITGISSSTDRGIGGDGCSIVEATVTTMAPAMIALAMRNRSGRLANTHMPRYRPNTRNITAYTGTTHAIANNPLSRKSSGGMPLKRIT